MGQGDHDILEHTRRAAIRSAGTYLETLDRARRSRADADGGSRPFARAVARAGQRPDRLEVLFEVLRLNANYLNQLAKLGERHGDVAHRTLEHLYSMIAPSRSDPATSTLRFTRS